MDLDLHYCSAVEGASQESNLWVARNGDASGMSDVDLQRFKNIAWNECVVKRFLPSQDGSVLDVGRSMLQIVRNLNLQWKGFEVMGLHPKVEAAEKQIVMSCMEKRLLLHDLDVGRIARCLRRCPHFRDHFANAVGCHIVAKTGHTPGLSTTQYNTDLDYVYKNQGLYFFESALKRNRSLVVDCIADGSPLGVDYIPRLCGLKLVSRGDVMLQNPPEKPGTPVVVPQFVRGESIRGDGAGFELAARTLTDAMSMFRRDLRDMAVTTDVQDVKRKYDDMMEGIQGVKEDQTRFLLQMQRILEVVDRLSPPVVPLPAAPTVSPLPAAPPPAASSRPAAPPPVAPLPAAPPQPVPPLPDAATVPRPRVTGPVDVAGTVPVRTNRSRIPPPSDDAFEQDIINTTVPPDPAVDMDALIDRFSQPPPP